MATQVGTSGVVKSGSNAIGEVTAFTLNQTMDTVEDTALTDSNIDTLRNQLIEVVEETLDNDITRNGNALHTQIVEASYDEGILFPYGGVRIVVRVLYEFVRGTS